MVFDAGSYREVVATYIRVLRQDSVEAADAIEQILSLCGARAALRATLVMTILKMEVQQHQAISDISVHAYMLRDNPEALPLLEIAISCWLRDRGIRDAEFDIEHKDDLTSTDDEDLSRVIFRKLK